MKRFGLLCFVLFFAGCQPKTADYFDKNLSSDQRKTSWEFNGQTWSPSNQPPDCQHTTFDAPVDVNLVSGILYPGQIRGEDYKPHGGFRFDNRTDNQIEVRAIMDSYLLKASRYDDGYDEQVLIFLVNECGLMVMHDHLLTLSPKLAAALENVPVGQDSRTTFIEPKVYFEAGELLATEIGYSYFPGGYQDRNVFVDFGLYDLRQANEVEYSPEFNQRHGNVNEYGRYAVCWLDWLPEKDSNLLKSLPAGGNEGTISDYCD